MNGAGDCRVAVLGMAFEQLRVVVTHPWLGQSRAALGAHHGQAME